MEIIGASVAIGRNNFGPPLAGVCGLTYILNQCQNSSFSHATAVLKQIQVLNIQKAEVILIMQHATESWYHIS